MFKPKIVGIVPHHERPAAKELAHEMANWLANKQIEVRIPKEVADRVGLPNLGCDQNEFESDVDVVVSLGGDGTMLNAFAYAYPAEAPVVGVNVGQLGYLSEVEPAHLGTFLNRLSEGDYEVRERMVLSIEKIGASGAPIFALNEAVVEKRHTGRLLHLGISINDEFFTTYAADGVIIATPTGSTAYSLSARGPVVSPRQRCLVVTPVSPHMLFDRSLVLGDNESIELEVQDGSEGAVNVDGRQRMTLVPGDKVRCSAASKPAKIASFWPRDFHQILKTKFRLSDR